MPTFSEELMQAIDRFPGMRDAIDLFGEMPSRIDDPDDLKTVALMSALINTLRTVTYGQGGAEALDKLIVVVLGGVYQLGLMRGKGPTNWRQILLTGEDPNG